MPALDYSHDYYNSNLAEQYDTLPKASQYKSIDQHAHKNKAPKNKIMILNFVLLSMAGVLAVAFTAIYSIVAISETQLSDLHSTISELNYENIDLENKLENVKSYYSVDTKVSATSAFEKAKNVIEVDKVNAKTMQHTLPQSGNLNTVTGF